MSVDETRAAIPEFLNVFTTDEAYFFDPVYSVEPEFRPHVEIARPDGTIRINEPALGRKGPPPGLPVKVYAIMGVINLLAGPYVIVVKERRLVGHILRCPIFHVDTVDILPCVVLDGRTSPLTASQQSDELQYLRLLRGFLQSGGFYYSPRYDLTSSLQAHHNNHQLSLFMDLSQTINNMFVANRALLGRLLTVVETVKESRVEDFLAICIYGFVAIERCIETAGHGSVQLCVISRRSTGRVGTRFHSRGIDDNGHVSNFVETEQVVLSDRHMASLLQCRGSIPLYWRQTVDMRYSPVIELYNYDQNERILRTHLGHLKQRYGEPVVVANLIDQKGREAVLGRALSMHIRDLADASIRDVPWDFHHHCRSLQWHNVSRLVDQLRGDLQKIQHFEVEQSANGRFAVKRLQAGIVRTNCMDCLDRTNVVQSVLARRMLVAVLADWTQSPVTVLPADLDTVFKNVWADNADAVSRQYSGTGALKTDFTRTGARTYRGAMQDLANSLSRYLLNNFTDAHRQDAMDLFFGHFVVSAPVNATATRSPFANNLVLPVYVRLALPLLIVLLLLFLAVRALATWTSPVRYLHPLVSVVLSVAMIYVVNGVVRRHAAIFVQLPCLLPPPVAITRSARARPVPDPRHKAHVI